MTDARPARSGSDPRRPRAVAVYGSYLYGQYFENILEGIVAAAGAAGVGVVSVQTSDGVLPSSLELGGQDAVSRVSWDHVDAAITVVKTVSPEYVARLQGAGKFVVAISQDAAAGDAVIRIDNVDGIRQAVTHLAGHGHTRIGFLSPAWQQDTAERHASYRDTLASLGLTALDQLGADLPPELSMDAQGYRAGRSFARERPCTAVVVAPDLIALGFLRAVRDAGLRVPEDVAVVGVDDVAEAAVSSPPLATVAISFEQVGRRALEVALLGGRGEPTEPVHLVPERFVPRESCGCQSGSGGSDGSASSLRSGAADPAEVFTAALAHAVQDGAPHSAPDPEGIADLAREVVELLGGPVTTDVVGRGSRIGDLAERIVAACALDRSVHAVTRAVRALADSLVEPAHARDLEAMRTTSAMALDLCDQIRSAQLQHRLADYVELKRLQTSHYFIGNALLSHDRAELRSLAWLGQTAARSGALGLWHPPGQTDRIRVAGRYDPGVRRPALPTEPLPVEGFPPADLLSGADRRLVVVTQVRFENSDWGLLAVAGGRALQSSLVQETFQQWSILMSASLDQEKADADLARQAAELRAAYENEMALIEEVRVSEERYALAAEAAQDALWDWDVATGRVFYSDRWKALLGYRDTQVGTSPQEWLERIHPEDLPAVRHQLDRLMAGTDLFLDVEHRLVTSTGEHRWISCIGRMVLDDAGRPARLVGSITDVTVRRLLQEQLVQEALFDGLTGLARGTLFKDRLTQAIELAKRRPDYRFAVLFIDLDGFKAVNDTLGHAIGDEVLASVAGRLRESLRRNDTAARLGGDEFAILLSDLDDGELPAIVERFRNLITTPHPVGSGTASVGASIGVAVGANPYLTAEALLHEADLAMYKEKRSHRSEAKDHRPSPDRPRR